jgi:protoporphyrin/coproporphyrin ferrochelatase
VELAMRYAHPSLEEALGRLAQRGVEELTVLPLYPLNAASSTSSSLARVYELVGRKWEVLPLTVLRPFFDDAGFLNAFAEVVRQTLAAGVPDFVLFSFHGLPERHIKKSDPSGGHCLSSHSCCDALTRVNRNCYRAQAHFVARALAERLGLAADCYGVSFQSRLGRTPWIKPFTDEVLPQLVRQGRRRVVVVCPSFVADCLETVEEIGIRGRQAFLDAGGEALLLAPSLNAHPLWVETVVQWVRGSAAGGGREGL